MTKENAMEIHKICEALQKIIDDLMGTIDEFSYFENEQDKAFYMAVRNFFMQQKQRKLIGEHTLKMVIEFDEEKIEKEGKYDLQRMYAHLAERFTENGLMVVKNGIYVDGGNEKDLMYFMAIATSLPGIEWFKRYIKKWDWYEDDWEEPEDLIDTFELVK